MYIAQLRCPLLAIGGENDCQVPAASNLAAIEETCRRIDLPYRTLLLKDLNHLGQVSVTGSPDEYASLGQAPDKSVLEALVQWLNAN